MSVIEKFIMCFTTGHRVACQGMANGDPKGCFRFISHSRTNN